MRFVTIREILLLMLILAASCTPKDSERCGSGFYYEDGICLPCPDGDSDTDTNTSTDSDADSDTDSDSDTDTESDTDTVTDTEPDGGNGPTGLGESCVTSKDCEGYDANYCLYDPFNKVGICTIRDCNTDPDDCPDEWWCCNLPNPYPPVCLPDEVYKEYIDVCENG